MVILLFLLFDDDTLHAVVPLPWFPFTANSVSCCWNSTSALPWLYDQGIDRSDPFFLQSRELKASF
jgi:hypothetical protein